MCKNRENLLDAEMAVEKMFRKAQQWAVADTAVRTVEHTATEASCGPWHPCLCLRRDGKT